MGLKTQFSFLYLSLMLVFFLSFHICTECYKSQYFDTLGDNNSTETHYTVLVLSPKRRNSIVRDPRLKFQQNVARSRGKNSKISNLIPQ